MDDHVLPSAPPKRAGRREWVGLAVLALPTLLLSIDVSVLYLALPALSDALGADATSSCGSWTSIPSCWPACW